MEPLGTLANMVATTIYDRQSFDAKWYTLFTVTFISFGILFWINHFSLHLSFFLYVWSTADFFNDHFVF